MSDERNIPDDLWRKAFDEASETPPPRVWDRIERQLDESEGPKVLPLWGTGPAVSRSLTWGLGLAAAVALLLVGWWAMRTNSVEQPVVAQQTQQRAQRPGLTQSPENPQSASVSATNPAEGVALMQQRPATGNQTDRIASSAGSTVATREQPELAVASTARPANRSRLTSTGGHRSIESHPTTDASGVQTAPVLERSSMVSFQNQPTSTRLVELAPTAMTAEKRALLAYEPLESRNLQLRGARPIQRIVWFRSDEADAMATVAPGGKRPQREVWASVSMMPGAFNPSVAVQLPSAAAMTPSLNANPSPVSQPSVNSKANFSIAYQAGAGVQLTERWSIESGIGYLAARSTVESPAQSNQYSFQGATVGNTSVSSNFYVDVLRNQSGLATIKNNTYGLTNDYLAANSRYNNLGSYDARTSQNVTNDYQYVQVPVQVGYQLRPRKRLSLAVMGGLLTNIFVRNTVDDAVVIRSKDGIYRPVSWAASMGARFRYRPSRRWSASLAGVYQPALGFGTQADSPVQTRPTSAGMTFGVDYHF